MLRGGVGSSTASNPKVGAAEATAEALAEAGLKRAEGALCFATTPYAAAYPLILRTVASEAGTREVAGCSGAGVIASEREIESGRGIAVLVFGGGSVRAKRLFAPSLRDRPREVAAELGSAARPALAANNLLCLFADTYNMGPESLIGALGDELPGVAITGGGASEDGSIGETFQFCGDVVSSNSAAGMLISGDFDLRIGSSLACAPVGVAHQVTAARDNVILELDGRPAYEVFAEAAGPLADDSRRSAGFVFLAAPLDPRARKIERGRYSVRNIVGTSKKHGVIAVAHRPRVGDTVGLLLRDSTRAREDLKLMLGELSRGGATAPAFGLYFDCVSRGSGLYGIPGHDSAYIRRYFGRTPVAGFFTGFEIGPVGDQTGLLQYSGVLALISAKA